MQAAWPDHGDALLFPVLCTSLMHVFYYVCFGLGLRAGVRTDSLYSPYDNLTLTLTLTLTLILPLTLTLRRSNRLALRPV
jgi:hypothetical protein